MGVNYIVVNLDTGELVSADGLGLSSKYSDPLFNSFAHFLAWLIKNKWNGNKIMWIADSSNAMDTWYDTPDSTQKYAKEFLDFHEEWLEFHGEDAERGNDWKYMEKYLKEAKP